MPVWGVCGPNARDGHRGCCASPDTVCYKQSNYYSQCRPVGNCVGDCTVHSPPSPPASPTPPASPPSQCTVITWGKCGDGPSCCKNPEDSCFAQSWYYSQCRRSCPLGDGWDCEQEVEATPQKQVEEEEPLALQPISVSSSGASGTPVALGMAGAGILLLAVGGAAHSYKAGKCRSRASGASAVAGKPGRVVSSSTNDHHGPQVAMAAITLDGSSQPPPPSSLPPV